MCVHFATKMYTHTHTHTPMYVEVCMYVRCRHIRQRVLMCLYAKSSFLMISSSCKREHTHTHATLVHFNRFKCVGVCDKHTHIHTRFIYTHVSGCARARSQSDSILADLCVGNIASLHARLEQSNGKDDDSSSGHRYIMYY